MPPAGAANARAGSSASGPRLALAANGGVGREGPGTGGGLGPSGGLAGVGAATAARGAGEAAVRESAVVSKANVTRRTRLVLLIPGRRRRCREGCTALNLTAPSGALG